MLTEYSFEFLSPYLHKLDECYIINRNVRSVKCTFMVKLGYNIAKYIIKGGRGLEG